MIAWKMRALVEHLQAGDAAAPRRHYGPVERLIRQQQFLPLILVFFLTQVMNCRMSADLPTVPALFVNASLMSVRHRLRD